MIKMNLKEAQGKLERLVEVRPPVVGNSLDHLFGLWSEEEEADFLKAIEVFEEIDSAKA